MAFPANLDTIVVRHKITDAAGRPLKGNTVTAEPAERVWATDGSTVQYRAATQIDANGQWELELPYVDQEGIRNKGVPWRVTEHVPGQPKSYFVAPVLAHGAGPIDAAECLVSAPTSRETVIQAGPVTDESLAGIIADPSSQTAASLKDTIGAETDRVVPAKVAEALAADDAPAQAAAAAVTTELVHGEAGKTFGSRERAVEPLPLRDPVVEPRGTNPIPTEFFGGYLWGVDSGGTIKRSNDGGRTWQTYTTVPGVGTSASSISRVLPTSDGEVLVVASTIVRRSTGWATGSPTWTTVLENPTPSFFHPWGISGDGTKFIIVHYSGSGTQTPDRADSRYGWISLDGGLTWTVKWDTAAIFGEQVNTETHIHACAYDPWEDRFCIAEGHVSATGVYVSYDDGDNWTKLPYGDSFDSPPGNAPTTINPTDYGVVFGSDDPTNGVMVLPRGTSTIERAWSQMGISNTVLFGYAHMGARDPRTGIVYQVWENNTTSAAGLGTKLTASDGQVAGQVWASDPSMYLWRRIAIDDKGNLLAWEQSTNSLLRAKVGQGGAKPTADEGRVLGGKVNGGRGSVAVGAEAVAVGNRSVAIGGGATTETHDALAIGGNAYAAAPAIALGLNASTQTAGLAVGIRASAANGTALGYEAIAPHANAVAVGRDARVANDSGGAIPTSVAVGRGSRATGSAGDATALGPFAVASGNRSTALGSRSEAVNTNSTAVGMEAKTSLSNNSTVLGARASTTGALNGVALGYQASVTSADSVAIGANTATTASNQVAVGPRDVEIQDPARGVILRSPNGTRYRLTVADDGALSTTAL